MTDAVPDVEERWGTPEVVSTPTGQGLRLTLVLCRGETIIARNGVRLRMREDEDASGLRELRDAARALLLEWSRQVRSAGAPVTPRLVDG